MLLLVGRRDENREKRVSLQNSLENFRIKKVFKLPDGMDTSFENPELNSMTGGGSGCDHRISMDALSRLLIDWLPRRPLCIIFYDRKHSACSA
eukprot:SAG31_NODE_31584_length_366_cov_0.958801_1_plen_92_part_10